MTVKRIFIYLVYFTAAAAVFAFVRFPLPAAAGRINQMAGHLVPGLSITLDRVSLKFPLGLHAARPVIRLDDTLTVTPRDLSVFVPVSGFFSRDSSLYFTASLIEGTVQGHLTGVSLSDPGYSTLAVDFSGLRFTDLALAVQGATAHLSFDLSGRYLVPDRHKDSAGSGDLVLSHVTCAIADNFLNTLGITALDFDTITLSFVQDSRKIHILALTASGEIMTVTAAGQIFSAGGSLADPENWTVDLKGSLHPRPAHVSRFSGILPVENLFRTDPEKGIPFTLTGPATALEINT